MYRLLCVFFLMYAMCFSQTPFTKGVNLTDWLASESLQSITFSRYDKSDLQDIKSLGADVIRVPVSLLKMSSGYPEYRLDPVFLHFLNSAVDMAEEVKINLIIDNHPNQLGTATPDTVDRYLIPVWQQIAREMKNRSSFVHYELLNEPRGITDLQWNNLQQKIIDSIRAIDTTHYIIVTPSGYSSYNNLKNMRIFRDPKIIYTFHFYDPFLFTHQGASWANPSLVPLAGMPFPYRAEKMPPLPEVLKNTSAEGAYNYYYKNATVEKVRSLIDIVKAWKQYYKVNVYCGEFGVFIPNSPDSDRVTWYGLVRQLLEERNIAWTTWDYHGGFGLYKQGTSTLFRHDLNIPLVKALGFNAPDQTPYIPIPDSSAITIYENEPGRNIRNSSSIGTGKLNFYDTTNPYEGPYSIYTTGIHLYGMVSFDFILDRDLTYLRSNNYVLKMNIRGDYADSKIDLRFIDSRTSDPADRAWRMEYTIDRSKVKFDNQWHEISVPLKDFREVGAYENGTWYNPKGLGDWSRIDRFDIVANHHDLVGKNYWFDNISISSPVASSVDESNTPSVFALENNYPNPFNASTRIRFSLPAEGKVSLDIYNTLGEKVMTLVNMVLNKGTHEYSFDAGQLPTGIYFYRLTTPGQSMTKKCLLLK